VLVTGATGFLGRAVLRAFLIDTDTRVLGTSFSRTCEPCLKVDLRHRTEVEKVLEDLHPNVVVHIAGERRADKFLTSPNESRAINVDATQHIAELTEQRRIGLLFISTDYVFDGASPPYDAEAQPRPVNPYGAAKLAGEQIVLSSREPSAILRVSILFGPVTHYSESPISEMIHHLARGQHVVLDNWVRRYPVHVDDVARAVLSITDRLRRRDCSSVFQLPGPEGLTFFDMGLRVAGQLGAPSRLVSPLSKDPRSSAEPRDARMREAGLEELGFSVRNSFPGPLAQYFT